MNEKKNRNCLVLEMNDVKVGLEDDAAHFSEWNWTHLGMWGTEKKKYEKFRLVKVK